MADAAQISFSVFQKSAFLLLGFSFSLPVQFIPPSVRSWCYEGPKVLVRVSFHNCLNSEHREVVYKPGIVLIFLVLSECLIIFKTRLIAVNQADFGPYRYIEVASTTC